MGLGQKEIAFTPFVRIMIRRNERCVDGHELVAPTPIITYDLHSLSYGSHILAIQTSRPAVRDIRHRRPKHCRGISMRHGRVGAMLRPYGDTFAPFARFRVIRDPNVPPRRSRYPPPEAEASPGYIHASRARGGDAAALRGHVRAVRVVRASAFASFARFRVIRDPNVPPRRSRSKRPPPPFAIQTSPPIIRDPNIPPAVRDPTAPRETAMRFLPVLVRQ